LYKHKQQKLHSHATNVITTNVQHHFLSDLSKTNNLTMVVTTTLWNLNV